MKKQLQIDAVQNGFIVREPSHEGVAFCADSVHVFSSAEALGDYVRDFFTPAAPVPEKSEQESAPSPISEAHVRALRPGDVVILNTGERSTVVKNDGTSIPIKTYRCPEYDETEWFREDGRLRCSYEVLPGCPRIVAIEKAKKKQRVSKK
jgi:hypothetical protein